MMHPSRNTTERDDRAPAPRCTSRHGWARLVLLLVLFQFVASSFACPALPQTARRIAAEEPSITPCSHVRTNDIEKSKLRHERYVSDQWVSTRPATAKPAEAAVPPAMPLPRVNPALVKRAAKLDPLLVRTTAPPFFNRLVILRI